MNHIKIAKGLGVNNPCAPECPCRSGEMADTEDLKSSEETPHAGSSPASGNTPIKELMRAHEALLMTLHASNHPWIQKVHRNAAAYYYNTWKKNYEYELNAKDRNEEQS